MRRSRLLVLMLTAAAAVLGAAPPAGAQTGECSASFHVLHDDKIGRLSLPAGLYQLETSEDLTCAAASHLFTRFLRDYDGRLPKPWRYSVEGSGEGEFTGRGSFTVTRTGDAGGDARPGPSRNGGGSHGDLVCPGVFEVMHDDRIGRLRIPAGEYLVTLLGGDLTCQAATRNFARFLERPRGNLPGGWILLAEAAEFVRGSTLYGFRIEPAD